MFWQHTPWWRAATCILATAPAPPLALAQDLAPPAPDAAYRAYNAVDALVRTPEDAPEIAPEAAPLPPVHGVCVTARLDGRVIASATRVSPVPEEGLITAAAGGAARDLNALALSRRDRERVTISVELAGALVPVHADTLEELAFAVSPGLDGIALAKGDRYGAVFPGAMLARTLSAPIALTRLATELEGDASAALTSPKDLRERGYAIYRFRTAHLAQPAPGKGAVFLHRGGRVADTPSVRDLKIMGDGMAAHLIRSRWPGVEGYGLLGTQDPATGRYDPSFAGPIEQATAAFALARFANTRKESPIADPARAFALELLESLHTVEADEREPWGDAASAAGCVIALAEVGEDDVASSEALSALASKCRRALVGAYSPAGGFAQDVPEPAWGMIAYALVRDRAALGTTALSVPELDGALRVVYRAAGAQSLVSHMPWLGWGELELADLRAQEDGDTRVRALQALLALRTLVWDHQLRPSDLGPDDRDLAGGVVFTRASTPLPTWHTARPLAFLATMLGDERLTPGSAASGRAPGEMLRVIDSMRFVRQLMPDEASGHMYARPERAFGGVRAAPWDHHISPEATALALLATTETIASIEAIATRTPAPSDP